MSDRKPAALENPATHDWSVRDWEDITIVLAVSEPTKAAVIEQLPFSEHQILVAASSDEALDLALRDDVDVLVVELGMEGIDEHICRRLRVTCSERTVAILVLTKSDDAISSRMAMECSADDSLVFSPDQPADLLLRLRLLAQLSKLRRRTDEGVAYRRLTTKIPVGVLAVDRIGTISYVNPLAAGLLGADPDDLAGQNIMTLISAHSGAAWLNVMNYALSTGMSTGPHSLLIVRNGGEEFTAEVYVAHMAQQGQSGLVVTITDISARIAHREELNRDRAVLADSARLAMASMTTQRRELSQEFVRSVLTPFGAALATKNSAERSLMVDLLAKTRVLVERLASPTLSENGLTAALGQQVSETTAATDKAIVFESEIGATRFNAEIEEAAYRVVDKAIAAAVSRSDVAAVSIYVWQERSVLCIELEHDGSISAEVEGPITGTDVFLPEIYVLGGNMTRSETSDEGTAYYVEFPIDELRIKHG